MKSSAEILRGAKIAMSITPKEPKSNAKSEEYRREGNQHFAQKTIEGFHLALEPYNKSICFAENGSKELALGYANRSAVYFELQKYKECLVSIEFARNVEHYPSHLNDKLAIRETKCLKLMDSVKRDIDAPKPVLSYPAYETIPFVANCVEIRRSRQYGRHLVTNRNLNVGDIIAIENPFCISNSHKTRFWYCDNCSEQRTRNLIPCEYCVDVMFCGEKCRQEAMESFHKYECAAINIVQNFAPDTNIKVLVRLILRALALFDGNLKAIVELLDEIDVNADDTTIFDVDQTRRLSPYGKFVPVACMVNDNEKQDKDMHQQIAIALNCILYKCNLVKSLCEEPTNRYLNKIAAHFSTVQRLTSMLQNVSADKLVFNTMWTGHGQQDATRGIYPFQHLLNHSCVPNIVVVMYGGQMMQMVRRPVKASEQLFIRYGSSFDDAPRILRQFSGFICKCEACVKNYPTQDALKMSPVPLPSSVADFFSKHGRNYSSLNRRESNKLLPELCQHLQKIDKLMPCLDLVRCSGLLVNCSSRLYEREDMKFIHMFLKANFSLEIE